MKFTAKQLFSIIDGRLSTSMDDVYTILNEAIGRSLHTLELTHAMDEVKAKNPPWFAQAQKDLEKIKEEVGDDFPTLMEYFDTNPEVYYEIYNVNDLKKIRKNKLDKIEEK